MIKNRIHYIYMQDKRLGDCSPLDDVWNYRWVIFATLRSAAISFYTSGHVYRYTSPIKVVFLCTETERKEKRLQRRLRQEGKSNDQKPDDES